jgi:hypothetical protein
LNPERTEHEKSPMIKKKRFVPPGWGSKHPKADDRAKWRMAKPFESLVPESLEESMRFERGKSPKKALDIGRKAYMCYVCRWPTNAEGENLPEGSEESEKTIDLFNQTPDKVENTYCSDCYYNDLAAEKEARQEQYEKEEQSRMDREEEERWEQENMPYY